MHKLRVNQGWMDNNLPLDLGKNGLSMETISHSDPETNNLSNSFSFMFTPYRCLGLFLLFAVFILAFDR